MIQNKCCVKIRLTACAIVALLGSTLPAAVIAVDDDYYIPYTDTYGYIYDPQTGTYVKQDSPATDTTGSGPASTTNSPADTSIQTPDTTAEPVLAEVPAETGPATRLAGMNVVLPALLLIAGVAAYLLISRKKSTGLNRGS